MTEEIKKEEVKAEAPKAEAKKDAKPVEKKEAPKAEAKPTDKKDVKPGEKKAEGKPGDKKGPRKDHRRPRREEAKEYEERVVEINRISKTVQGGRHMRFSALVVIGDKKGKYGFAMEKSGEVPDAIKKSLEAAKHNMFTIHIVKKGFTIAHEVMGKYGATKVYLKPAPAGTGIIAGGPVRAILELGGLKNVVSKVYGARASINVIRATHNAIINLKSFRDVQTLCGKLVEKKEEEAK